jgi:hypothetical protein
MLLRFFAAFYTGVGFRSSAGDSRAPPRRYRSR